eukprot:11396446-Ditylum_brightwellii.AAC.1
MLILLAPHQPIALLFKQLEDGKKFTMWAGVTFTNDQLVMCAKQLILGTGQYGNAYRTWIATPLPKMYQQLKTHFTVEY